MNQLIRANNMLKHLNTELEPIGKGYLDATTFMMSFVETANINEYELVTVLTNYEKSSFDTNCSYNWQYVKKGSEFFIDVLIHYYSPAVEKADIYDVINDYEKDFMSYYFLSYNSLEIMH